MDEGCQTSDSSEKADIDENQTCENNKKFIQLIKKHHNFAQVSW